MCSYKILLKISGSIAAYKSAYLASQLIQQGCEVQVVATPSAFQFIGKATFEGLTGRPLLTDGFEQGSMMSHIHLAKWADLTILAPGTANTMNKMAAGIADNLVTSLFLAHDRNKPYLVAPAMNTAMMNHPATQQSIAKLKEWGIKVLETAAGKLACGDEGYGKMLDPDEIMKFILEILHPSPKKGNILITSGGTREKIDGARDITNFSTGRTGAEIADYFIAQNWDVTLLHGQDSVLPLGNCKKTGFIGFASLDALMKQHLQENRFSSVIHLAAVSDYSIDKISTDQMELKAPAAGKIDSQAGEITIRLTRNPKILNRIRTWSPHPIPLLVAFKFTVGDNEQVALPKILKLKKESDADVVVWNDAGFRESGKQTNFSVFTNSDIAPVKCSDPVSLAGMLEELILKKL